MKIYKVGFIIMLLTTKTFAGQTIWDRKYCDWDNVTQQEIESQETSVAISTLKGSIWTCAGVRANRAKENKNKSLEENYMCYTYLMSNLPTQQFTFDHSDEFKNGDNVRDEVLKIPDYITQRNCTAIGDKQFDHMMSLFVFGIKKLSEMRQPIYDKIQKKLDEEEKLRKQAESEKEKKLNSPNCNKIAKFEEYCGRKRGEASMKVAFENEKKLNSRSGTVRPAAMRGYNAELMNYENQLTQIKKEFNSIKSSVISLNDCQVVRNKEVDVIDFLFTPKLVARLKAAFKKYCDVEWNEN